MAKIKNVSWHRARAKKYGTQVNDFSNQDWERLLESSGGKCFYCEFEVGSDSLVPDHKLALCRGGDNTASNIAPACKSCNCRKGQRTPEEFRIDASQRKHTSWHQRLEARQESFQPLPDPVMIETDDIEISMDE